MFKFGKSIFKLAISMSLAMPAFATAASESLMAMPSSDIVETLVKAQRFKTLATALEATQLLSALQSEGPFTVFAPTDAAFAKLGKTTIDALLNDPDTLSSILLYHVVPGNVDLLTALQSKSAMTLNGADVAFNFRGFRPFVNDARIVRANIKASNGIIHVIDSVLIPALEEEPAPLPSIPEIVTEDDRFSTLLDLVIAADLVEVLASEGPFTVFAPTNEAFAKLPAATVEALLADKMLLQDVLLYHVIAGAQVNAETAVTLSLAEMANGKSISLNFDGQTLKVNQSTVTQVDVQAANGVIHVIDTVLIP